MYTITMYTVILFTSKLIGIYSPYNKVHDDIEVEILRYIVELQGTIHNQ
jgi:hypothetical protein